jgi:hypothetical protein
VAQSAAARFGKARQAAYHPLKAFERRTEMARLIRMDGSGHTTLAEWTELDDAAFQAAVAEFRDQQELGYIGTVPDGPGKATHVRELPREADLVIMRRPIAGG